MLRPRYWMIFVVFCITAQFILPVNRSYAGTVDNDPEIVNEAIEKVSSDRRFVYPERLIKDPWQQPGWIASVQEWMEGIAEWLDGLFGNVDLDTPEIGPVATPHVDLTILVYILYGLGGCVLIYLIYRLVLFHYPRLRNPKQIDESSTEEMIENLDPGGRLSLAEKLMRDGRWAEALSALMISLLLVFDARGLVRYHRSRTNKEYLRGIRKHPVLFSLASEFVHSFEKMKFGHQVPDREGTMYLFDLYNQTEQSIPATMQDQPM